MCYDLKVICVGQKKPRQPNFSTSINLVNEFDDPDAGRYHTMRPFMCNTTGVWYTMETDRDGLLDAGEICESDFEYEVPASDYPYWIEDENVKYELTPLIIRKDYEKDFFRLIEFLIDCSPIKTIILLARYQGADKETVCGVLTLEEFKNLLNQKRILFNVDYIIGQHPELG